MKKIAKIIAVCNQKGGVGKTVTTVNLGIGLARQDKRVLLVDVDPQGSLTASLGYHQPDQFDKTLSTVLGKIIQQQPFDPAEYILHQDEGVDLLPANIDLAVLEMNLVGIMGRETVLRELLETVRGQYDYILLDCCPSLGTLTANALTAADEVIIPMLAHYLSIKGLEQLLSTIGLVRRKFNPHLQVSGILITMANMRTAYSRDIVALLRENYGDKLRIFDIPSILTTGNIPIPEITTGSPTPIMWQKGIPSCGQILRQGKPPSNGCRITQKPAIKAGKCGLPLPSLPMYGAPARITGAAWKSQDRRTWTLLVSGAANSATG